MLQDVAPVFRTASWYPPARETTAWSLRWTIVLWTSLNTNFLLSCPYLLFCHFTFTFILFVSHFWLSIQQIFTNIRILSLFPWQIIFNVHSAINGPVVTRTSMYIFRRFGVNYVEEIPDVSVAERNEKLCTWHTHTFDGINPAFVVAPLSVLSAT